MRNERTRLTKPTQPDAALLFSRVSAAVAAGVLTNGGPNANELEEKVQELLKAPTVLTANGTLAIALALKALGAKGEVITTPFTFAATLQAIELAGCTPVMADIDYDTLCLSPDSARRRVSSRTGAFLPVHVFGRLADTEGFDALGREYGALVVYDGAHAFLREQSGQKAASFGDATAYSFHATKLFHCAEGGAVAFPRSAVAAERARKMRAFGMKDGIAVEAGMNAKLNELSAALGLAVLKNVFSEIERRRAVAAAYDRVFSEHRGLDPVHFDNCQYYVLRVREPYSRDAVMARLAAEKVETRRYFWPCLTDQPAYSGRFRGDFKNARRAAKECLSLPFYGELGVRRATEIAQIASARGAL